MQKTENGVMAGDNATPNAGEITGTSEKNNSVKQEMELLLQSQSAEIENVLPETKFLSFAQDGDYFDCIYQGKKKMKFEDEEERTFASFVGKDGNLYLSQSWKLLQIPDEKIGYPMRIIYRGKIQKDGKQLNLFDVYALRIK